MEDFKITSVVFAKKLDTKASPKWRHISVTISFYWESREIQLFGSYYRKSKAFDENNVRRLKIRISGFSLPDLIDEFTRHEFSFLSLESDNRKHLGIITIQKNRKECWYFVKEPIQKTRE